MKRLDALFAIEYGNKLDMNKMAVSSSECGVAFVGRLGGLNGHSGVSGYVEPVPGLDPYPEGLMTVALGGSRLLSAYVQQRPFYTAQNVAVLTPLTDMSIVERLYYAMCIRANAFRYSAFGREANRTLSSIEVPDAIPSWAASMSVPSHEGLSASVGSASVLPGLLNWSSFALESLFEVKKGKRVTRASRAPGVTRFIGASDKNNGITDHCDLVPNFDAGTISVPYNGSVGFAFYQDQPYFACDDIQVLIPRISMNKWVLLFITTMIRYEKDRFTYGYKWNLARMRQTTIMLPVTSVGEPDWSFMEEFMKGLPFSAAIADD